MSVRSRSGVSPISTNYGSRPVMQKVLYLRQNVPDNHVDDTFLASLVTNANVQTYEFLPMMKATLLLVQQISVLVIFFLIYGFVHSGVLSISSVVILDGICSLALIVAQRLAPARFSTFEKGTDIWQTLRYIAIFLLILFCLSPVLQTLTQSYCNDTIWAWTILLSALHIMSHQYHITTTGLGSDFAGTISLNAAMFAAVLLASRLPSTFHVFVFIVLAIQLFALFPLIRDYVRVRSEYTHLWAGGVLIAVTLLMLLATSTLLATVYLISILFIMVGSPLWLQYVQKYKNEIQGPWDIASVTQLST